MFGIHEKRLPEYRKIAKKKQTVTYQVRKSTLTKHF